MIFLIIIKIKKKKEVNKMTKKDEEMMGYCCICIIVMTIIGLLITYWYITLPAILIILSGYVISALISKKKEERQIAENFKARFKNSQQKFQENRTAEFYRGKYHKFGERLHPDEWYEEKCSYCGEMITKTEYVCKFCGHNKRPIEVIEKRSRHISSQVKREVWQRDYGKCVECGSKERLEYDHIIPFSKGGSNTVRNIQLLCENCNRKKHDKIK